jgi:AcrR family transcriptional regulator
MTAARQQKAKTAKAAGRGGRPSAAQSGEVEARLLDAAARVFLERGFEGASFDRIAALAHAGKATLYAKYPSKADLFTAIVRRSVEHNMGAVQSIDPGLALHERLRLVGLDILHYTLQPRPLCMMRLVIETAHRFPEIAQHANRIGWEGGVERVARVIAARNPESMENAKPTAAWFISLTFAPQQMRALLGETHAVLEAAAPNQVAEAITLLSRGGWLEGWL